MNLHLANLHNGILNFLYADSLLPNRISYNENCQVSEYLIYRTLVDEKKSPYFTYNHEPIGLNLHLKELLLYTIYCAPIYASIKSSNAFAQDYWDYWRFHQKLSDKLLFPFVSAILPVAQNNTRSPILNMEYDDKKSIAVYQFVYIIISQYFNHFSIDNGIIHPQDESEYASEIGTLLVNMHDVGLMLFGASRSNGDSKIAGVSLCPNSVAQQLFSIAQWS